MRTRQLIPLVLLLLMVATGCNQGDGPSQLASGAFTGTVQETIHAGGYTYARIRGGQEEIWAAASQTNLAVGAELTVDLSMKMDDFHSDTLDRTFDAVYFVDNFRPSPGAGGGSPKAPVARDIEGIQPPADGVTVAEIWDQRQDLAGQVVTVRGKVVKMNTGILDRTWVHLQDGSGDGKTGTHDVTVTTQGSCQVGDVVVVKGTVAVDRDFGAGYLYGVIVEDATLTVEQGSTPDHESR